MKLAIVHHTASDLNFHSSLFRMQSDQLSFERFEELFEGDEEDLPNEPLYDSEWKPCENFFMHSNQSAMFVVVADVMEFFGRLTQRVRFLISYEIKYETTTAKLTLNAGELEIDVNTICGSESEIKAGSSEIYKDLLAVTSTTTMVRLEVVFEKTPKLKFQDFLVSTMRFAQLSDSDDTAIRQHESAIDESRFSHFERMETDFNDATLKNVKDSFFFYSDDNYFKGMLVRLKTIDPLNISLKLYPRSNHLIVTFSRAVYSKYCERCRIEVKKGCDISQISNLITENTQLTF